MYSQRKNQKRKVKLNAIFSEVASTSFLTLSSMLIPSLIATLCYKFLYGIWFWEGFDVYSGPSDLFGFYVICSLGYLVSLMAAWAGGITFITKIICLTMFVMVVDNLVMALDAMDLATWDLLESLDSALQLACGAVFMLIGAICLIAKLWRYVLRYSALPFGF